MFYEINTHGKIKFYKNLKKLCLSHGLKYSTIYYHIKRYAFVDNNGLRIDKRNFEN